MASACPTLWLWRWRLIPRISTDWSDHYVDVETQSELTRGMTVVDRLNVADDDRNQAVWASVLATKSQSQVYWTIDNRRWKKRSRRSAVETANLRQHGAARSSRDHAASVDPLGKRLLYWPPLGGIPMSRNRALRPDPGEQRGPGPNRSLTEIKKAMIDKHLKLIEQAAKKKVKILCLQELFYGPYFCAEQDIALVRPDRARSRMDQPPSSCKRSQPNTAW